MADDIPGGHDHQLRVFTVCDAGPVILAERVYRLVACGFVVDVVVLGVFAISSTAAAAQQQNSNPNPPPVVFRDQVEVVATRLPDAPHDVPVPIEVIDGDTLRNSGATTLSQALSLATGVVVAPGGD